MQRNKGLTLIEVIVVIIIVLMLLSILIPFPRKAKEIDLRIICGTNLKSLGTAMRVYAIGYNDNYPQLPGRGPWSKELGFPYFLEKPDFNDAYANAHRSITASLYLLVREADVFPKTLVCPESTQEEFDGFNPQHKDILELWDFGYDPYKHVSYSYRNPYGKFPADKSRSAAFAVMADMNPWFNNGNLVLPRNHGESPQIITPTDESTWKLGNSHNHELKVKNYSEGQNVLFADANVSYEKQPNVGVKNDNIYTFWSAEENPTEQDRQGGTAPTGRSPENDAKSKEDSFLGI